MDEKEIARLVRDNGRMSYTLGFVYGGLSEMVSQSNLPAVCHTQVMALLQLLHKNCNEIFYKQINECHHEDDGVRYAVLKLRSTDEQEYEYKCLKCQMMFTKDE